LSDSDIAAELATLKTELRHTTEAVEKLTEQTERLTAQANRWKGAFGMMLAVTAVFGWLANTLTSHLGAS
jgi:hypothetical protein